MVRLEAFGPAVRELPWGSARGARERLEQGERARLVGFEDAIFGAWSTDDPVETFARALLEVWRNCHFVFFPGAVKGPPRWTLADQLPRYRGSLQAIHTKMQPFRAYGDRARDPFANRPAGCHDLALGFGRDRMEGVVDELLEPVGFRHQLRSVLYDRKGAVALFAGLYRTKGQRPFGLVDHARLHAMQPVLRRWTYLAEALGTAPIGTGDLAAHVERIDTPCFVAEGKRVVLANKLARTLPRFGTDATLWRAVGSAVPLRTKRLSLDLVLLPRHLAPRATPAGVGDLPPYLRAVANELVLGASDKEIASRVDAPLSTVRTYVTRVLARSGVRSRRDLMCRSWPSPG